VAVAQGELVPPGSLGDKGVAVAQGELGPPGRLGDAFRTMST